MAFNLPKELLKAEWKSHKANLVGSTGIGAKLEALSTIANNYVAGNGNSSKTLREALKVLGLEATRQRQKVSGVFPKTQAYLLKMSTVANQAVGSVEALDAQAEKAKIQAEKRERRRKVLENLPKLTNEPRSYFELVEKNRNALGVKEGDLFQMRKAITMEKVTEATNALKALLQKYSLPGNANLLVMAGRA
jgi:hypothetical protein